MTPRYRIILDIALIGLLSLGIAGCGTTKPAESGLSIRQEFNADNQPLWISRLKTSHGRSLTPLLLNSAAIYNGVNSASVTRVPHKLSQYRVSFALQPGTLGGNSQSFQLQFVVTVKKQHAIAVPANHEAQEFIFQPQTFLDTILNQETVWNQG